MSVLEQQDCVTAIADLAGRSGARELEIGWLRDPDEPEFEKLGAGWYVSVFYKGLRLTVDEQPTPAHACDGVAHKLLDGGTCAHCLKQTTTAQTPLGTYEHGASPPAGEGVCVWYRDGAKWVRGCE